jgi:hypothetical protein
MIFFDNDNVSSLLYSSITITMSFNKTLECLSFVINLCLTFHYMVKDCYTADYAESDKKHGEVWKL